jgi:adenosylhomocysteinase
MNESSFEAELDWALKQMPRTRRALASLPDLAEMHLACSLHIDLKIAALVEGLLQRGAQIYLVTCNPDTVRDRVVDYLRLRGAAVEAWRGMPAEAYRRAIENAAAWGPTHLCELGADLTVAVHRSGRARPPVQASLEGTGSGIARLDGLQLAYPVFNWDDLPVKEGLHNRHMVGLSTWQTFFARTRLTLHEKRVVVIGYGLVGQGLAASARAFGGAVAVVEKDPVRAMQAAYDGWQTLPLEEALRWGEVIVTATGAKGVVGAAHFAYLRDGAILLNAGHAADEIEVEAFAAYPRRLALPFVEEIELPGRVVYLLAGGSMFNLVAGEGDSLNAFDLTLAVLAAGVGFIAGQGAEAAPGIHVLPRQVWEAVL